MDSILLLAYSPNCSQEQFSESLKELVDSRTSLVDWHSVLPELDASKIKQCVVGPHHLAFLMEDGSVCRIEYQVNSDRATFGNVKDVSSEDEATTRPTPAKKTPVSTAPLRSTASGDSSTQSEHTFTLSGEALNNLSGQIGRWTTQRVAASTASTPGTISSSSGTALASRAATARGRGRIIRTTRGRAGSGWLNSRSIIPASAVPEELIAQAQVVLQGKSRQVIIRELQKTSLDVNLAVNNLLSRDDDDPDDPEEESYMQEAYIPSEDLMSIFEAGIPGDEPFVVQRDPIFPEDIIYNPSFSRTADSRTTSNRSTLHTESSSGTPTTRDDSDREFLSSRIRDKWWGMLMTDGKEKAEKGSSTTSKSKTVSIPSSNTTHRFGEVEWWRPKVATEDNNFKFTEIASLHSELLAVTEDGFLHQWKWCEVSSPGVKPRSHGHPRAKEMKLTDDEIITKMAACNIRLSIVTESGKVATWLDHTLSAVGHKLEHPLQAYPEFKGNAIAQLHVCDLYSCVQLTNSQIYWWGVFPYEQRKKILDKVKTKAKKSAIAGSSHIKKGTLVCIRSCPLYYPGAIGFTTINGEPRVGELMDKAWSITETCRFKILDTPKGNEGMDFEQTSKEMGCGEETNFSFSADSEQPEVGSKRKHSDDIDFDNLPFKEEEWCLADVIFVEEVRNVPIGEVLLVDGPYALIHFSQKVNEEGDGKQVKRILEKSSMRRKDELQIVKWTSPPKMPECYQRTPKQLILSGNSKVLTMTLDNKGVHAILKSSSGLRYAVFSLASGRPGPGGVIQPEPGTFLSRSTPYASSLYSSGAGSIVLLKDPNRCIYPLVKDNNGGIQNPNWSNLSALRCFAMGSNKAVNSSNVKSTIAVSVMVLEENKLIQSVLRSDSESVRQCLEKVEDNPDKISRIVKSKCDGNRNIVHVCVSTCKPVVSKTSKATDPPPANNGNKEHERTDEPKDEPYEPSLWMPLFDGLSCLEVLLNIRVLSPYLFQLLSDKDAFGFTPFMTAVRIRAYSAAQNIYQAALDIATEGGTMEMNQELFMAMICPSGTEPDKNPLHMLCCNDTCSFTWTGTKHINQDIFECKTCGLVGPLCCCTECAQVCHIGHECKLKRTSPTAYCDCWEKCPCKALVPGDQTERVELLHKLVDDTDLCTRPNKKGHHILLFLAQTVARQTNEQLQYVPNRNSQAESTKSRSGSNVRGKVHSVTPPIDYELEPPKFAKTSLSHILKNWKALKSMVLFGCNSTGSKRVRMIDDTVLSSSMLQSEEIERYLNGQNGTSLLDNFVHKLIVKCGGEFLETLLQTLQSHFEETKCTNMHDESLIVVKRFIRAVVRVYVVLAACTGSNTSKKKGIFTAISKCKRVFVSLNMIAAQEMADVASTIFAPVRMGVVYPSAPFTLGTAPDSTSASDDLFSAAPLPERPTSSQGHTTRVRFAAHPDISEGNNEGDEEMETEESASQEQSSAADESHEEPHVAESDTEIDLLAESDSDSEESNNGDRADSQSSSRRSRSGDGYFSTAETSDTDGEEEEEEEVEDEDEDDDDEEDDTENQADSSETRTTTSTTESSSAPHALQWAVRNSTNVTSTSNATTTAAHVSGSGLVFIDTAQVRRSGASASSEGGNTTAMYCTSSALARTFSILVREVADLLSLTPSCCSLSGTCLPIEEDTKTNAKTVTDKHLSATWEWLWKVMESTEAQLRFGASLTAVSDPGQPQHPLYDSQSKSKSRSSASTTILRSWNENRRKKRGSANSTANSSDLPNARHEYLSYILSLMRSHENEHGDSLPKVEITSLRHVAYVLDAFIYYLRSSQNPDSAKSENCVISEPKAKPVKIPEQPSSPNEDGGDYRSPKILKAEYDDEEEDESESNETDDQAADIEPKTRHKFFKRSDSTLVLGYEPADPFAYSLKESLPLADRPHLLNPSARRDQLFGVLRNSDTPSCSGGPLEMKLDSGSATAGYLSMSPNVYLARWHMCLELFGRVFLDDVGIEPCSVLNELGRFDVKEVKFRREMEKLRNGHQKDLYLEGLDRSRTLLLQQSLRQLNSQFGRRLPGAGPLNVHRLKVSFKDEPGEGSGVVRSFYTAISNALLSDEKLPNLDNIFSGTRGLTQQLRARARERERERRRSSGSGLPSAMIPRVVRRNERVAERTAVEVETCNLSLDAPPYIINAELDEHTDEETANSTVPIHKRELGRRIYNKVRFTWPEHASKITGMLLELTPTQLIYVLTHDEAFKEKINEAVELITEGTSSAQNPKTESPGSTLELEEEEGEDQPDNCPLFFQPGKPGYYSPRIGRNSPERLNCMRNVGRIIGLCLLQNEICPLSFNRHVIKYLLGKKISWHDLAFFDPILYESLRHLIDDAKRSDSVEIFSSLDLTYCIQMRAEEGGGSVELTKGGSQIEVAPENILDYVKRYAEYRMVTNAQRALQAIRRGLLDVIPACHLEGLTAEDFRLLLNGAGDINVQQLMNYTFFSDETGGEGQDKLTKFKKWFWSVVENMTPKQKQDLLYFWTSSPAMPASAEGFQPMPSVTVKPANDHQLPTANTCISRLYVPLYSSKTILRNKFLLAIKTKVFGFV